MSHTLVAALTASAMLLGGCTWGPGADDGGASPAAGATATAPRTAAGDGCEDGTYKIAYQGPLSGDYAALGENMINGVNLAVQEAVGSGALGEGVELEVVPLDSQGSGEQAPPLARQAAGDDEIVAMVGPSFWYETQVSGPILEEAGIPFITPSATTPSLSEQGWEHFFRTVGSDRHQGPVAAAFIARNLGADAVAIIDDSSEYGKPLADYVEQSLRQQFGVEIVQRQAVEAHQQDYSAAVARVARAAPEAIFFGGYYPEAGLIKRQLAAAGAGDVPFVSDDGSFDSAYFEAAGVDSAEPSYVTYPGIDVRSADPEFVQAYEQEYGSQPGAFSVEAYQSTRLVLAALAGGACDRAAVRDFVADFEGEVAGKAISFDDNGDIESPRFTVYRAEDGEWVVEADDLVPPGPATDDATDAPTDAPTGADTEDGTS